MIIDSSRLAISLKFDRHEAFAIIDSELTKISEQVTRTPFQTYLLEAEHHVIVAAVFVIIAESNGREPRPSSLSSERAIRLFFCIPKYTKITIVGKKKRLDVFFVYLSIQKSMPKNEAHAKKCTKVLYPSWSPIVNM